MTGGTPYRKRTRAFPGAALPVVALIALAIGAGCTQLKRFSYEGFRRDRWQHPERVIDSLATKPGSRVADLGSGGGYFTFRLAETVGADGKVYAVDVDSGMVDYVAERSREEGYGNVEVVLAKYDDPSIPDPGVDLIFTCNTYHHIEERAAYFERARKYLRPGGRVAIIDYKGHGWFQRWFGHFTKSELIKTEMEAAGYGLEREFEFLPRQHFLIFSLE